MKSLIALAAVLAVVPTASQAAPPAVAPPGASVQELQMHVTQLANRTQTHARALGLRVGPVEQPADTVELLVPQEQRLTRIVDFLSQRSENPQAVDERRLPSARVAPPAIPVRIAREYAAAARQAVRLGIARPSAPEPADTAAGQQEQLAYWRTVSRWLQAQSERVRPDERPLSQRVPHYDAWMCIAKYESGTTWTLTDSSPYYGGLQMDREFQEYYAPDLYRTKGTADHWSPEEQMLTAEKALPARGFTPWPNTARMCGLL